jgi:molybdate transport system substrate-binding protein
MPRAFLILLLLVPLCSQAQVRVAVASNFVATLEILAEEFERQGGGSIEIIPGSSGKLYAQIKQQAPYDLFLSADLSRAESTAELPHAASEPVLYAEGRLVLWSSHADRIPSDLAMLGRLLSSLKQKDLAIANPRLAPYGKAAQDCMDLHGESGRNWITGENVSQAFQYARSGNAEFCLISMAQGMNAGTGAYAEIPVEWHEPIEQYMVLLELPSRKKRAEDARAFWDFLQGEEATRIIESQGYAR